MAKWLYHLHGLEHMRERVKRLEEAIREVFKRAPDWMREVIHGLQALRVTAEISTVTVIAELGRISCSNCAPPNPAPVSRGPHARTNQPSGWAHRPASS